MTTTCTDNLYQTFMPASLSRIDEVCGQIRGFLARLDLDAFFFDISLVIREALVNAVVHGCGNDTEQRIQVSLRIEEDQMLLEVEDPGNGFNWQRQKTQSADLTDVHGRGISIFQYYCNSFEYNEKGNKIRLFKSLVR